MIIYKPEKGRRQRSREMFLSATRKERKRAKFNSRAVSSHTLSYSVFIGNDSFQISDRQLMAMAADLGEKGIEMGLRLYTALWAKGQEKRDLFKDLGQTKKQIIEEIAPIARQYPF